MKQQQSITSLPPSPDADRHSRMLKYGIMMGIRVICLFVVFLVHGWWIVIPALGAVFLPYFAVVIANVGSSRYEAEVERPGSVLPYRDPETPGMRGQTGDSEGAGAAGASEDARNAGEDRESADRADHAGRADHADPADAADYAGRADHADPADHADSANRTSSSAEGAREQDHGARA
jgi:hypothetical protein